MNTLGDIAAFTGVDSLAGLHIGQPRRPVGMNSIVSLVPLLSGSARTSLRSMIDALQALPPISLTATVTPGGRAPFTPTFRVAPSSGVVVETVINYFRDSIRILLPSDNRAGLHNGQEVFPDGTVDFPVAFQEPASYVAVVTRRGITGTGVTVLEQRLTFSVVGPPAPQKPPPPPPPQQQAVTCIAELDLDEPGSLGMDGVRIHGGGFVPAEPITILDGDGIAAQTTATTFGFYSAHVGVARLLKPVQHVFQAHGGSSGRISNQAGYTA